MKPGYTFRECIICVLGMADNPTICGLPERAFLHGLISLAQEAGQMGHCGRQEREIRASHPETKRWIRISCSSGETYDTQQVVHFYAKKLSEVLNQQILYSVYKAENRG